MVQEGSRRNKNQKRCNLSMKTTKNVSMVTLVYSYEILRGEVFILREPAGFDRRMVLRIKEEPMRVTKISEPGKRSGMKLISIVLEI